MLRAGFGVGNAEAPSMLQRRHGLARGLDFGGIDFGEEHAGLVAADVSPVELRRQGLEQAVTTGSTADYGRLVRVEEIDGDYVDNHWPDAVAGQIYRKTAVSRCPRGRPGRW